ncbi:MAG: leucine-rich repeat domain-containing protein, partial [Clostridia bacterium]|nr:leucine-rich repeat domain-containing protein [Clostridia bacterium]
MKKAVSLILCLIIVAGLFASCGKNKAGNENGLTESQFIKSDKNEKYEFDVYEDYTVITAYIGEDFRVSIPSKLGGKPVRGIGENAIGSSMLAIEVVDIPAGVVFIDPSAFADDTTITGFTVSGSNSSYKSEKGIIYSKDGKSLLHYPAGRAEESFSVKDGIETVGAYAFANNEKITKISLPDSVTALGEHSFEKCDKLYSVKLPDSIKEISAYAFYECTQFVLKKLPSSLEIIGEHAFDYCHSIQELNIPDTVHEIGDGAFFKCESLQKIFLPASLSKYGYKVFAGCELLTDFEISPKCTGFTVTDGILFSADGTTLVEYPYGKTVKDVVIPDGVEEIRAYSFFRSYEGYEEDDDDLIKTVDFNAVKKIGAYAFA